MPSKRIWIRRCCRRPGSVTRVRIMFNKGGPYLARGAADLVPTAQLLDTYSPELFCTVRNYHDIEPKAPAFRAATATRWSPTPRRCPAWDWSRTPCRW